MNKWEIFKKNIRPNKYTVGIFIAFIIFSLLWSLKTKEVGESFFRGFPFPFISGRETIESVSILISRSALDLVDLYMLSCLIYFIAARIKRLLIVVIVAVIVGGGILAWQYGWIGKGFIPTPKIIPREISVSTETTSWNIYENRDFNYEIKYPKSTIPKERELGDTMFLLGENKAAVFVFVTPKEKFNFTKEFYLQSEKYEKIIVGGQEMLIGKPGGAGGGYEAIVYKDNDVYKITLADYTNSTDKEFSDFIKTYNQMLSTFKFSE